MLRILHCVNNMHRAGLETMLMNYYRHIDRTRIQFDFLTHRAERSDYDDEIEALGGRIYRAPRLYPQNYPAYFRYMRQFFQEHPEYTVVHSHIDAMSFLPLLAAKKAGVPIRIAHSHSVAIDLDFKYPLKQSFRRHLNRVATHTFACGEEAGRFLFYGRDFTVIPNAVDPLSYRFDAALRRQKREELDVADRLVVGHVGRMTYAKNHEFLLTLFTELLRRRPDALLLLVGTGEKENDIKKRVHSLGVDAAVRFLGSRSDVTALYQAMDVFVLPSHFEGIPVVGIEAQFAGLPCLFSEGVPREVCFTDRCRFESLSAPPAQWAEDVLSLTAATDRHTCVECDRYDIRRAAAALQDRYVALQNDQRVVRTRGTE